MEAINDIFNISIDKILNPLQTRLDTSSQGVIGARPPRREVGGDNCGSLQEECLEFSAVTLMVDKHETEILSESFILTSTTSGMSLSFM